MYVLNQEGTMPLLYHKMFFLKITESQDASTLAHDILNIFALPRRSKILTKDRVKIFDF